MPREADLSHEAEEFRHLRDAADRLGPDNRIVVVEKYGSGNIHDTFLVKLDCEGPNYFILQRMNTQVFRQPHLVTANMRIVTEHIQKRLDRTLLRGGRRWEVPRVFMTRDGQDHWIDPGGSFWRAMSFIGPAQSYDTINDLEHAREVGLALGTFQNLICDLPIFKLHDTLVGFHITPRYLDHFDAVLGRSSGNTTHEVHYCLRFINKRRLFAGVLERAKVQGTLPHRPIHGDPKVNNVMIDTLTRQAISLVDLDTVKPGLAHYDIGDCLRSSCNPLGEETERWEAVHFETDICRAILQGYLSLAGNFLTEGEYAYLFDATRLIAFELGLRFFTDYLAGNVYFKAKHQDHNLKRALVQFRLTESIEAQEASIRSIIRDFR